MDRLEFLEEHSLPFAKLLGIKFVSEMPERIAAQMMVREDMCTIPAVLHGDALMALADTLGGAATLLNLRDGATTTTIESKTNFFALAPVINLIDEAGKPRDHVIEGLVVAEVN